MQSSAAWRALTRRDLLLTSWPWRSLAYLVTGVLLGEVVLVVFLLALFTSTILAVLLVGIPLLLALGFSGIPVAALERRRLRIIDPEPAATPHRMPDLPGLREWISLRLQEQATWRELAYVVLLVTVLWPIELLAVVFGLGMPSSMILTPVLRAQAGEFRVLKFWLVNTELEAFVALAVGLIWLALALYPLTLLATAHGMLARLLLAPRETEMGQRLDELTRSRTRLVEAFEVERRRIERDLHDGAQQRLVALAMTLGLAKLTEGSEMAELVDKAHGQAKLALAEIRDLIRGIHPQILTDRGLSAAVADLADRSPVPVEVSVELPVRLPEVVESVAYFVVSEALTNVAKHSDARRAWVTGRLDGARLVVEIRDDGAGGADVSEGTGLAGLADRVSVVNGRLMLSSPHGGPTLLRMEIPCTSIDPSK
ncbi:signal transduction histidine kinase [Streptosporangium album]|uniref:histidine kinase n=1 Tax=Streptosporangium album TaxID=47479 RepID=A0A7W7WA69_9ACTN|nr:sensor domain-containing protein [Streptosporangium album]MBB4940137.1 signal transduction histidine kinase [Streptosporangium album]